MQPVEILPVQETIVLRARGSELLIMPQHVKELKGLAKARDFSQYFRAEALVNRPARKLFEAWLRKDQTLWTRLYHTIHKEMTLTDGEGADPDSDTKKPAPKASKAKETVVSAPKAEKAEKPAVKAKEAVKETAKPKAKAKEEDKPAAKAKPAVKAKAKDDKPAPKAKADAKKAKPAAKKK